MLGSISFKDYFGVYKITSGLILFACFAIIAGAIILVEKLVLEKKLEKDITKTKEDTKDIIKNHRSAFLKTVVVVLLVFVLIFVYRFPILNGGGDYPLSIQSLIMNLGQGGVSVFALASIIIFAIGVIMLIVSFASKEKSRKLIITAASMLLIAGIFIFLTKVLGTSFESGEIFSETTTFKEYLNGYKMGSGIILFGIFTIFSSIRLFVASGIRKKQ